MTSLSVVSSRFDSQLVEWLGTDSPLLAGIRAAVGAAPGQALTDTEHPIYGYWTRLTQQRLLMYVVTPGRLVCHEVDAGRTQTSTVPIERVTRVLEDGTAQQLRLVIEIDAGGRTSLSRAQWTTSPDPDSMDDGTASAAVMSTQVAFTTVELIASDEADVTQLAFFSRALRLALGW